MTDVQVETVVERALHVLGDGPAGIACDFDGTLSPIVPRPEAAELLPGMRPILRRLASCADVLAIVSGRPVADLVHRVGVPSLLYIGNHGLERWANGEAIMPAPSAEQETALAAARAALETGLCDVAGIHFEEKNLGLAIHYRDVPDPKHVRERIIRQSLRLTSLGLEPREGKRVVELRFAQGPTKGTSVEWLSVEFELRGLIFIGDDYTDVDAFRALATLRERDGMATLSIAVLGPETPTEVRQTANLTVDGPEGVAELLRRLAEDPRLASR